MTKRRHTAERLKLERLETRRLLAIERPFVEHIWESTLGDVVTIAVVADLDGDGRDDIVARGSTDAARWASAPNNAWYKLNSATHRFEVAGILPSRNSDTQYLPSAAVDFDSDGDLDLLMRVISKPGADEYTSFDWIENLDGKGTFGRTFHRITGADISARIYIADLDDDGDWDAAFQGTDFSSVRTGWAENIGGEFTYHSLSSGSLWDVPDDSYLYDVDGDGQRRSPQVLASSVSQQTFDIDRDGDFDWVYRTPSEIVWEENVDGQATFETRTLFQSNAMLGAVQFADVDQDEDLDIWVQLANDTLLLENSGSREFTTRSEKFVVPGSMVLGDFADTGRVGPAGLDAASDELIWYEYDPTTSQHVRHAATVPRREVAQALADMNGDRTLELVGLRAWYELSDSLASFVRHDYHLGRMLDAATPMDVNGDGEPDLIVAWNTGTTLPRSHLSWLQQNGAEMIEHPIATNFDMSFAELRALDVDLDGDLDLLALADPRRSLWEPLSSTLEWWENTDGQGAFTHRGVYADGSLTSAWHLADIDGDGDLDRITIDGELLAWRENVNDGEPAGPAIEIARLPSIRVVRAADLNGDGDLDLVVSQDESFTNHDWMYLRPHPRMTYTFYDNQDGRGNFARVDNTIENRGILALVGDINGDGAAELIESPREIEGIIIHENVTPTEPAPGDINQDGSTDVVDVDQFCMALSNGEFESHLDVNRDGQVTFSDFEYLVEQLAGLKYGDASLDRDFDSSDLVRVLQRGHYEDAIAANSGWQDGDWNCDREFSTMDLVTALQHGSFEAVVQDQLLLVAHRESDRVLSFDAATGEFVAEFARFESPLEIEIGPDGDVYVVQQTGPPRITRYRASGEFVTSIVIPGRADFPRIAFSPDGDLYAAYFLSRQIERFRIDGDAIVSLGDVVGPGVIGTVNGFDVGPEGDLYVAVGQTESIWRFSGETGERLQDFAAAPQPEGMAFGPDGDLYVGSAMPSGAQIRRYDGMSGELIGVLIDEIPSVYGHVEPDFTDDGFLLLAVTLQTGIINVYRYDALTGEWIDVLVGDGEIRLEHPIDLALLTI